MARELGLDLVEVADKAAPPVCRIMDYGRYKYQAAQRAKESRRKSSNIVVKEMKYRPKIGVADFDTKTRQVERFLGEGHKVKVTIMFRGREMQHPELGKRILDEVAAHVAHLGRIEAYPKLDGRNMTMVLGPDKRAQAEHKKSSDDDQVDEAPAAEPAAAAAPLVPAATTELTPTAEAALTEPAPTEAPPAEPAPAAATEAAPPT
jgi:translation initiation factor IF-3